jgi:hypothetical protein
MENLGSALWEEQESLQLRAKKAFFFLKMVLVSEYCVSEG